MVEPALAALKRLDIEQDGKKSQKSHKYSPKMANNSKYGQKWLKVALNGPFLAKVARKWPKKYQKTGIHTHTPYIYRFTHVYK